MNATMQQKKQRPAQRRSTHPENEPLPIVQHDSWCAGDTAHQGDLMFIALKKMPPQLNTPRTNRQLADGSTVGSRHVIVGGELFDGSKPMLRAAIKLTTGCDVDEKYIGPVFSSACVIEHPKHQHHAFPNHKATVVVYQRNLDAEEREMQARD